MVQGGMFLPQQGREPDSEEAQFSGVLMRFRRHVVVSVLGVAIIAGLPAAGSAEAPRAPRVWLTTGDQKNLLALQPCSALRSTVGGAPHGTGHACPSFE